MTNAFMAHPLSNLHAGVAYEGSFRVSAVVHRIERIVDMMAH